MEKFLLKKYILLTVMLFAIAFLGACSPEDTGPRAQLGNPMANILIEEFSDFECPACAVVSAQLEEVVRANSNKVLFHYYHFPLPQHAHAFKAAEASECAFDQGKFWEYSAVLFKNQRNLTEDNLKTFAVQLGLDQAEFDKCLDSGVKKSRVKNDLAEGMRRSIGYTPSIFINGELFEWSGAEQFELYLNSL
jgi:protein-disulfide isomerase